MTSQYTTAYRIASKPVNTFRKPEPQHVLHSLDHGCMAKVEIRLLLRELVEIELLALIAPRPS